MAKTTKNIIKNGYIILARIIRESAIWQDSPDLFKLFLYLLIVAHHDKKPKRFNNFEIKRGELITSLSIIAEDNQYYEQKAIRRWSRQKVARMLRKLKEQERIELITDTYGTHISICNYDLYQNPRAYKADNSGTVADNSGTTPYIYNNGNNGNNGNNDNKKKARAKFTKPTVQEVSEYANSINYISLNSQLFVDTYDARGWMIGKNKMKDWRAAVRTWRDRENGHSKISGSNQPTKQFIR